MKKLNIKLRKPDSMGLFHDSRADSALFMKVFNAMHDKVNEIIDENEILKKRIEDLEKKDKGFSPETSR